MEPGNAGRWSLGSQSNYLLLLAQCQTPHVLRSRLDPADVVQKERYCKRTRI